MKKFFAALLALAVSVPSVVKADEGMWLLPLIEKLNIKDMKEKGFKLEADDLYNPNGASIMSSVAIFGGGCTSELISSQGLLLTNHHCGYGAIQMHSSVEHDYLKYGFWAKNKSEEIPTPGLKATFVRSIENVTEEVLSGVKSSMNEEERAKAIEAAIEKMTKKFKAEDGKSVLVKSFFGGNEYYKFVMQVYSDVRMVGVPPSSIGKFGGDTDNWMWPRHTGDFAIFRIYADKDGNPADYSADNKPYEPKKWFNISLDGVKKDDFAMVMGFPGSTKRYMTSYEIDETTQQTNPIRIKVRGVRQDILMDAMQADQKTNIQYASKYARSSNYWKNSIGMNRGLAKLNVKATKEGIENSLTKWISADQSRAEYAEALPLIEKGVANRRPFTKVTQYIQEALLASAELYTIAGRVVKAAENGDLKDEEKTAALKKSVTNFYKDYNAQLDRKVAKSTIQLFVDDVDASAYPETISAMVATGNLESAIDKLYDGSMFASEAKVMAAIDAGDVAAIEADPAVVGNKSIMAKYREYGKKAEQFNEMFAKGHRLFIAALAKQNPTTPYYPDANFTLRMTYGQVLPYDPADGVTYNYTTTLEGIMQKEDPNNQYEFHVPEKLKELYQNKDFGRYGEGDNLVVNFITNNDITGGNSGSPVINGNGELIGTAFDGNWEAMSGDIAFEPALQRCIVVDIRYTLFIIEKFGGAKNLIDEMTIVKR